MTGEKREDPEDMLERCGRLARRYIHGNTSPQAHAAERERIRTAFEQLQKGRRPSRGWWVERRTWVASFGVAAIAAVIAAFVAYERGRTLTYTTDPGTGSDTGYFLVPEDGASTALHFSDGSEVRVAPGGKIRVGALRRDEARLSLHEGTASLHVVHRNDTHWAVDAGPFVVEVTGTSFDVGWSTRDEAFDLTVHTGSVIVRGPLMGEGLRVEPGQRLRVRLGDGEFRIEPAPGDREHRVEAAPVAKPIAEAIQGSSSTLSSLPDPQVRKIPERAARGAVEPPRPERARLAAGAPEPSRPTWSRRVAVGDYAGVLAETQSAGLETTLAQRPLGDLTALSDAARYLERIDVARQALLAQRVRFPGSPDAKGAAFLLGRISQDGGDPRTAIEWFTRYLAEASNGPFAAEALGRKLVATKKVYGVERAKPLAREYLDRFPNGAHAFLAREVAEAR